MTFTKRPPAGWLYLASFIALGVGLTILGPALSYLRDRAHATNGEIAVLFVTSAIGYVIGSLLSGWLYDHGFGHRATAIALIGIGASMLLLLPFSSVRDLSIVFAIMGLFGGCVDVGGNTLMVWHTRGSGSVRMLNAMHMFFGIGALVVPLLVNRSLVARGDLSIAVGVVSAYCLVVAVLFLLHETPRHTREDVTVLVLEGEAEVIDTPPGVQTPTRLLAIVAVFFVLYVGVELGFSGWLKTYAEGLPLPGNNSPTYLNTLFFLCFTFGRLIAVVISKHVRSGPLLFGSCALSCTFMLIMAIGDGNVFIVWTMTALFGISIAPQFATMFAYTEEHVALTGRATSWFIGAAGIGGLALPYLIGQLLDDSVSLMPVTVFVAAVASTAWLFIVRVALINHRGVPAELLREPV